MSTVHQTHKKTGKESFLLAKLMTQALEFFSILLHGWKQGKHPLFKCKLARASLIKIVFSDGSFMLEETRLQDKVAIVTRSGLGIGKAVCAEINQESASIIVASISSIKGGAHSVRADVSNQQSSLRMAAETIG